MPETERKTGMAYYDHITMMRLGLGRWRTEEPAGKPEHGEGRMRQKREARAQAKREVESDEGDD